MTPEPQITPAPSAGSYRHLAPLSINGAVALAFAAAGIPVFPVAASGPRAKQPLTEHGFHDATTDLDQVRRWWTRWPDALVGIPTGPASGIWVLDIDGEAGRRSLNALLARLGLDSIADLTRCVVRTPGGGLHLYFRLQAGECPRNRARDIGDGIDTRAVKADGSAGGYIIAAGSVLPDGRRYQWVDAAMLAPIATPADPFGNASPAPHRLLYLATFNDTERAVIKACADLREALRDAEPADWSGILQRHQAAQREALARRTAHLSHDGEGMRAQAAHDLAEAAAEYSSRQDGRREALFTTACRLARYVANDVLPEAELRSALREAAAANGALAKYGARWLDDTITRALARGRNDVLPPLARRFRNTGRGVA